MSDKKEKYQEDAARLSGDLIIQSMANSISELYRNSSHECDIVDGIVNINILEPEKSLIDEYTGALQKYLDENYPNLKNTPDTE